MIQRASPRFNVTAPVKARKSSWKSRSSPSEKCFNVTAPVKARKLAAGIPKASNALGFNVTAPVKARKCYLQQLYIFNKIMLQCDRAGEGAEIKAVRIPYQDEKLLQCDRAGEGAEMWRRAATAANKAGFNVTAPVKARKSTGSLSNPTTMNSFNVTAPVKARKSERNASSLVKRHLLQCDRAGEGAEMGAGVLGLRKRGIASM